ncbi:TetR/AcrR family transcriptional regulator [Microbacterium sp. 18062]|uniref:TetR/AcrR family transcriptional regulator n=1 Tax=Microbacterium sp. 18062 TaxID=2681410 RepID=UPI001356DFBD|nr:hypothetical protein [Microbacterium sp. 18062]
MTAPTERRERGRPRLVDRDAVVDAAIALGLSNLTMTALAETLGVRHSTLYRHVGGRDDIVTDAIDRVFDATEWPAPGGDWRQHVRDYAATVMDLYRDNPGMAAEAGRLRRSPDGILRALNSFRSALLDHGLPPDETILLSDLVMQLTRQAYDFRRAEDGSPLSEDEVRQEMRGRLDDVTRGADPRVRDALIAFTVAEARSNFDAKLDRIIRGFDR